jgi:hypothetical protein
MSFSGCVCTLWNLSLHSQHDLCKTDKKSNAISLIYLSSQSTMKCNIFIAFRKSTRRQYEQKEYQMHSSSLKNASLKVPKCEILMSWILIIFYHEVSIGRGLEDWNKIFTFFTDGWDTGHFVLATACAVYASKLLSYAPSTLALCYRMRRIR